MPLRKATWLSILIIVHRKFLHGRLEARIASERIEKWIGFDKGNVVSVALLVGFLKKAERFLFLVQAQVNQREVVRGNVALLLHGAQSFENVQSFIPLPNRRVEVTE